MSEVTVAKSSGVRPSAQYLNQIPREISEDPVLLSCISQLPSNYSFEVEKTIWRIRQHGYKIVGLQLPEGFLVYSMLLSDIIERFAECQCIIMADVT
jgi:2-(3-amino-3-carboxypropyl)histidine synthase